VRPFPPPAAGIAAALSLLVALGCSPDGADAELPPIDLPLVVQRLPDPNLPPTLALIDLKAYQVLLSRDERRVLVRALIENQSAHDLASPFRLDIALRRDGRVVGTCRGEQGLPAARVALCEVWIDPRDQALEGAVLVASLARSVPGFAEWDKVPLDDTRHVVLRTLTDETGTLRIRDWVLDPVMVSPGGEVGFRFAVDGAHLVWVMTDEKSPRLLAGHPADGLLEGAGRIPASRSGPVTLIARNSLGIYVYRAAPVLVTGSGGSGWVATQVPVPTGEAAARPLDPGVYDVHEQDQLLLDSIRAFLRGEAPPEAS